jgi:hypothetical protein
MIGLDMPRALILAACLAAAMLAGPPVLAGPLDLDTILEGILDGDDDSVVGEEMC